MAKEVRPKNNLINPLRISQPSASKSVSRTAKILTCLSNGLGSITDIAHVCQVNKSTIHRLLGEFCQAGLATQDPNTRLYSLGPLISQIASRPEVTHQSLVICAAKEMRTLAASTGETIGLTALIGLKQISLHEIPSIYEFRIVAQKIFSEHMHAGATARVLLSQLDKNELDLVLANLDFKPLTECTITSQKEWLSQMEKAREQGYAISYNERIVGAMCISAAVRKYKFPVAIEIVGPEARMKPRTREFAYELLAHAERVEHNLVRAGVGA